MPWPRAKGCRLQAVAFEQGDGVGCICHKKAAALDRRRLRDPMRQLDLTAFIPGLAVAPFQARQGPPAVGQGELLVAESDDMARPRFVHPDAAPVRTVARFSSVQRHAHYRPARQRQQYLAFDQGRRALNQRRQDKRFDGRITLAIQKAQLENRIGAP
jgi:hypothetical protein